MIRNMCRVILGVKMEVRSKRRASPKDVASKRYRSSFGWKVSICQSDDVSIFGFAQLSRQSLTLVSCPDLFFLSYWKRLLRNVNSRSLLHKLYFPHQLLKILHKYILNFPFETFAWLSTLTCLKTPTSKKFFFTLLHWKYMYFVFCIVRP